MNRRNPIVYFEEDGTEHITNSWGKILDMTPHVNDRGYVDWIELGTKTISKFGCKFNKYWIGYQKSFKVRLQDGQAFEFKGNGRRYCRDDMEFNNEFLHFVEDYHNSKYEPGSKLHVTSEVEFMDI